MSDGMRPPMGGGMPPKPMGGGGAPRPRPPMGGASKGPRPGTQNMSMFNPTDMAAKAAMGDIRPDMTVGEFLQTNFGVSPEDPVTKLMEATKSQLKNKDMAGKLGVPSQQGAVPRPAGPAPTRPPASPMGGQAPRPAGPPQGGGGLDALVSKL